jgi:putative transposase
MSRPLRTFEPNVSIHVIHRGNNRTTLFGDDEDYEAFLLFLKAATQRHGLRVHGFVLMSNHYHVVATPTTREALPAAMKSVNVRFVRHVNQKHERVGTLFCGRYRALPIQDETYWLTCLRYVELNPVRARMVRDPDRYRWSSYRHHAFGEEADWLDPHPCYLALGGTPSERQCAYRALCKVPLTENELVLQHFHPQPAP